MSLLLQGIYLGLLLSLLVGPIIFALLQTTIERGTRAGFWLGLGIWISDLLFVVFTYQGMAYVTDLIQWPGFTMSLGVGGGIILICLGLGTMLSKAKLLEAPRKGFAGSPLALWTKGFAINTFNPFTLFFWISTTGALLQDRYLLAEEAGLYYFGILGTIIFTDILKILLAKLIRKKLKSNAIFRLRQITGVALIFFGLVLLARMLSEF